MTRVDARTRANRKNAQKSTGPITDEGKARSRANAFKHGLAGQGVAWPGEEQAEVDGFVKAQVELERPQDERETFLAARAAALAWQIVRADRVEAAKARERGARGKYIEMERRDREVEELGRLIEAEPKRAVRSLLRSKEGCEWVLLALGEFLDSIEMGDLMRDQVARLDALVSPPIGGLLRVSRARLLVEALSDNPEPLWPQGIPGLDLVDEDRPLAEREQFYVRRREIIEEHRPRWHAELCGILRKRIGEVEALLAAHRAEPDPGLELAELIASFDDTAQGERLRRYQRANVRERRLTLRELEAWRDGREERESRPEVEVSPEAEAEVAVDTPPAGEQPAEPAFPSETIDSLMSNVHGQAHEAKEVACNWLRSAPTSLPDRRSQAAAFELGSPARSEAS